MKPHMNEMTVINVSVERLGVVASPKGLFQEEGVLNPAVYQDREGNQEDPGKELGTAGLHRRPRISHAMPCTRSPVFSGYQ